MSKKINLVNPNKVKPNLHKLFHIWFDKMTKYSKKDEDYLNQWYSELADMGCFMDDDGNSFSDNSFTFDGYDDEDAYNNYWKKQAAKRRKREEKVYDEMINFYDIGNEEEKRGKKKHKRKRHKSKKIDINTPYCGWEDDPTIVGTSKKTRYDGKVKIWYYPDYNNKEDRLEFDSLLEFDAFCYEENFFIPKETSEEIAYRSVNHVCRCGVGNKMIVSGATYYDMAQSAAIFDY